MNTERYRFNLGAFECSVVSDGTFTYPRPSQLFLQTRPVERLSKALREHDLDPARENAASTPIQALQ